MMTITMEDTWSLQKHISTRVTHLRCGGCFGVQKEKWPQRELGWVLKGLEGPKKQLRGAQKRRGGGLEWAGRGRG